MEVPRYQLHWINFGTMIYHRMLQKMVSVLPILRIVKLLALIISWFPEVIRCQVLQVFCHLTPFMIIDPTKICMGTRHFFE